MSGEVVLFEGGRSEGGFGVKEAGEMGDEAFALASECSVSSCTVSGSGHNGMAPFLPVQRGP